MSARFFYYTATSFLRELWDIMDACACSFVWQVIGGDISVSRSASERDDQTGSPISSEPSTPASHGMVRLCQSLGLLSTVPYLESDSGFSGRSPGMECA